MLVRLPVSELCCLTGLVGLYVCVHVAATDWSTTQDVTIALCFCWCITCLLQQLLHNFDAGRHWQEWFHSRCKLIIECLAHQHCHVYTVHCAHKKMKPTTLYHSIMKTQLKALIFGTEIQETIVSLAVSLPPHFVVPIPGKTFHTSYILVTNKTVKQ